MIFPSFFKPRLFLTNLLSITLDSTVCAAGTRQPCRFLPHPHGSPCPSLANICHATMLPRVGACCHVRHMHAAWRGTANTSWAFCHGPVTTTRRHACRCRRSTWRSDLWTSLCHHPQLGGVAVATAEQLRAPCARATSESRRRRPASEPGVSGRPRIIKMIFLFYQDFGNEEDFKEGEL